MRILYLINFAGKGGSEKYVRELIEAYHPQKAECHFAYNVPGLLWEQLTEQGIPCLHLPMKHPLDRSAARKLARYCREKGIDLIHAQYPRENLIALLAKRFYPHLRVVYTAHLLLPCGRIWRALNRRMTRRNSAVLAVCTAGKAQLIRNGFPGEKISVVFNGVAPADVPERTFPAGTFSLLTLTRYTPEKGVPFLLDAMAALAKRTDRPFHLQIAGDGPEYDAVTEKIQALGLTHRVTQLGYRTDGDRLLSEADLFVSGSQTEALSYALLEALAHRLPLVVTDVGGNSDVVNDATGCGFRVPYGDARGMAEAIARIMEDEALYQRLSANAGRAARERFDREVIFAKIFEIYTKAMEE